MVLQHRAERRDFGQQHGTPLLLHGDTTHDPFPPCSLSLGSISQPRKKKKKWQHSKTSRTQRLPSPQTIGLGSKWSPCQCINAKATDWHTTRPKDWLTAMWSARDSMPGGTKLSHGEAETSPRVQVWTRTVSGKRKFPKPLHTHSGRLIPQAIKSKQIHPSHSLNQVQKTSLRHIQSTQKRDRTFF